MSAVVPASTATTESVKKPIEYVVLSGANDDKHTWQRVATVEAANADQAIKKAAGDQPGTYVAVPARSWAPKTLTVETTPRVKLS